MKRIKRHTTVRKADNINNNKSRPTLASNIHIKIVDNKNANA